MIEKTRAIVLRYYPFSNTSRIVSWLTREAGKIGTMVKGSQRPKSHFLGQYDLFYTCELVFYAKERTGLQIARECSPLKTRTRLREDWKASAIASYMTDAIARISPPHAPHPELFELLDSGLDYLAEDHGSTPPFLFWFDLKLLAAMGLAPRLQHCLECDKELVPGARQARFSYSRGGILCSRCAGEETHKTEPITPDILAMMTAWQQAPNPLAALTVQCTPRQISEMEKLLGWFLVYHLDTPLQSRAIALDVLKYQAA